MVIAQGAFIWFVIFMVCGLWNFIQQLRGKR